MFVLAVLFFVVVVARHVMTFIMIKFLASAGLVRLKKYDFFFIYSAASAYGQYFGGGRNPGGGGGEGYSTRDNAFNNHQPSTIDYLLTSASIRTMVGWDGE